ncbi:hypothetical protein F0562_002668 [Nyssa sinensis]|uniref:peroxidase n=1 Tax=Nyssa sinensis TaxID=561372 RepID=A0A5J5BU06_9ASTE|nr:hypothetical protein F0562_002668 [Nyssa sinensis]
MAGTSMLLVVSSLLLSSCFLVSEAQSSDDPLVSGLSWTFYQSSCPELESIIRKHLKKIFKEDIGQAAGLLRLHFHDCFVQGCDGSVLLDGSASGPSEQEAPPNLTLRPEAFEIINDLRALVHNQCSRVVSCADITAIAAREAVYLSGGPYYDVPLGRRDGLSFATRNTTLANLPAPTSNTSILLSSLATKNFDATDVVALSGGHTIGRGHCTSFTERLYPTQDSTMDKTFANNLKGVCPTSNSTNTTLLDIRTPNKFDNKYYVDLMNRQGLFTSDQDLYTDKRTRDIVKSFAVNQTLFFEKFISSMIKMGQLSVLTGTYGEIRANCSVRNSDNVYLSAVVEEEEETCCPEVESIVRKHLKKLFKKDIGLAAGLLRLHFHDCFVQGCDGSVLLDGSASGPSEQEAPPNLSLRPEAFQTIDELRELVHKECGRVVSCADITALAARDSVHLSGGPDYDVPLGRRDGLDFATRNATLANLPAPTSNTTVLLTSLATKHFDATDIVALSGGHTIGRSHCASFDTRLYPTQDPTMDETLAKDLKEICPTANSNDTTVMDIRTPNHFDNKYYVGLVNRQGLFTSDQDLYMDSRTRDIVTSFAGNQTLFFEKFVDAMIKMGQLKLLTGEKGEIRANCSVRNSDNESYLASLVEDDEETRYMTLLKRSAGDVKESGMND